MSSGGDLFTSSQTAPAAVLRDFGDHTSPQDYHSHTTPDRKRKMDKEGFVTPATPDIPKSSLLYATAQEPTTKRYECAADMFEEVAQRTKMLIIQMAQNFRESEEYESMCLANVEALLMEARDLETSLRHQKDLLQERIFMIGRRLSTDNQ
ncbi:hypothetical protein ACOMHN_052570 [Nucella lapillus]